MACAFGMKEVELEVLEAALDDKLIVCAACPAKSTPSHHALQHSRGLEE